MKEQDPAAGDGSLGLVRGLLGFFDRNLERFSPAVQNTVGLGVLAVFIVYVLNGFVAPTFIRGGLFVRESATAGKAQASGYTIVTRNEDTTTNLWGNWMLPVYRSGIPGAIKIVVYGPNRTYIDETTFFGPWPVWSAVVPLEYDLEIRPFEAEGQRIRVVHQRLGEGFLPALVRRLEWTAAAHAQTLSRPPLSAAPPAPAPSSSAPRPRPTPPPAPPAPREAGPRAAPPSEEPHGAAAPEIASTVGPPKFVAAYGIEMKSITVKRFPSLFRASGRIYFTVTLNGTELKESDLLSDRELRRGGLNVWVPAQTGENVPRGARFPVRSIKESWIPVRAGETERFEGLIANLTPVVTFTSRASSSREPTGFTVRPQGRLDLHVWADNDAAIGSFDITGAVAAPNTIHRLTTTDDTARIEIQSMAGWVTAQNRY